MESPPTYSSGALQPAEAPSSSSPLYPARQHLASLVVPLILAPLSLLLLAASLLLLANLSEASKMAGFFSFLKALLLPALLAALLYALLSYLLLPLYRRHRNRYSQYLPVATANPMSTFTSGTSSLRSRVQDALLTFLLPSRWAERRYRSQTHQVVDARDDEEEMVGGYIVQSDDDEDWTGGGERRDGLSLSIDAREAASRRSGEVDYTTRLCKVLEEGFADDSEDEEGTPVVVRGVR